MLLTDLDIYHRLKWLIWDREWTYKVTNIRKTVQFLIAAVLAPSNRISFALMEVYKDDNITHKLTPTS